MVIALLRYLARDELQKKEKSYAADFEVVNHEETNYIHVDQLVSVAAIKSGDDFQLDTHGFCTIKARTSLKAEDALIRSEEVENAYFAEIEVVLCRHFPEYKRVEPMEFVVSAEATVAR